MIFLRTISISTLLATTTLMAPLFAEQPADRICLSAAAKLAHLSVAKIRSGVTERSPVIPASFSGRLRLTSGVEHLVPRGEQGVIYRGLILATAASKPQEYASIAMAGNGFGFNKPAPTFHSTDSSLGPLMALQYDGTGSFLFGSFFQTREGKNYVMVVPMARQHSGTGEIAALPELGAVETELNGGSLYYHIASVPGLPMAMMLKGGFSYQVVGINGKNKQIEFGPEYEMNPAPKTPGSDVPMTFADVVSSGFHWRSAGLSPKNQGATIHYSLGEGSAISHYLAPAKLETGLKLTTDWKKSIEVKSDAGALPLNIRMHPDLPLAYAVYKGHYEIYIFDHLAGEVVRLEEKMADGKMSHEFKYPEGLDNIEDIHFYSDIVNFKTGETTTRIAAVSRSPENGDIQILWLDDNR